MEAGKDSKYVLKYGIMTKKTKRLFFYTAVAVFLILSYVVMLYAQGYKYSFSEGTFQRTGAISLKVNTGAKVFLDDEVQGDTSFFSSAYSIDRLLPGNYTLSIHKDGYSPWQKKVTVEGGFLVDFPEILILPEDGEEEQKLFDEVDELFKELEPVPTIKLPILSPSEKQNRGSSISELSSKSSIEIGTTPFILDVKTGKFYHNNNQQLEEVAVGVKGFRLSENENKIAWWTANEFWVMWLNDTSYQPFYKKGDKELITRFLIPIQNGAWFRGEDHFILELEQKDSRGRVYSIYRIVEIDKRGGVNIVEL